MKQKILSIMINKLGTNLAKAFTNDTTSCLDNLKETLSLWISTCENKIFKAVPNPLVWEQ